MPARTSSRWEGLNSMRRNTWLIIVLLLVLASSAAAQDAFYNRLTLGGAAPCTGSTGTGSPNSVVTGSVCDWYLRTDGGSSTVLYIKESGTATTSGWVGYGTSAGTVTNTGGNLTLNALVLGAGTNDSKVLASLGTTTTLLHGNASGVPSFGAVSLTAAVSGTLPVGNGGLGVATLAAHGLLIGNGASAVAVSGAGTSGQVLTSNGAAADPTFQTGGNGTVTATAG